MFQPKKFTKAQIVPLQRKGILFSVPWVTLEELVETLGPPQESDGPHENTAHLWMIRIDEVLIGLEYSSGLLAVFSESPDLDRVATSLGFTPSNVTRYQTNTPNTAP